MGEHSRTDGQRCRPLVLDCNAWTLLTPTNPGGLFSPYGFQFETDGSSLYTLGSKRSVYQWTPAFQVLLVQIEGGTNAADAPATTVDPTLAWLPSKSAQPSRRIIRAFVNGWRVARCL